MNFKDVPIGIPVIMTSIEESSHLLNNSWEVIRIDDKFHIERRIDPAGYIGDIFLSKNTSSHFFDATNWVVEDWFEEVDDTKRDTEHHHTWTDFTGPIKVIKYCKNCGIQKDILKSKSDVKSTME